LAAWQLGSLVKGYWAKSVWLHMIVLVIYNAVLIETCSQLPERWLSTALVALFYG